MAAFADGCTGACVTDPIIRSTGAAGTVMRQTAGKGLYAAYDGAIGKPTRQR